MAPNNDCRAAVGDPEFLEFPQLFGGKWGKWREKRKQYYLSYGDVTLFSPLQETLGYSSATPRPPRLPRLLRATGMCWSTEVTLAFVLLEMCCCAIIAAQGLHGLLLAFGPLVLQEVVQLLLWLEIDRHDRAGGGGECSAANTALSFVELALVCGLVPVGFALLAIRSLDEWQAALAAVCRGGLEPRTSIDRPHTDLLLTRVYATPRLHWAGLGFRRAAAPRDRGRRGRGAGGAQARALPPTLSLH
jgi:hypothetical protein